MAKTGAHPRVSGENFQALTHVDLTAGSSPRERGKRNPGSGRRRLGGLIPA